MSDDTDLAGETERLDPETRMSRFFRRQAPYLVVLALALGGVTYTSMSQSSLNGFWEFLAALTCIVCIFTDWDGAAPSKVKVRLVWTQALHWVAVLIAMNVMLLGGVQQMLTSGATSLILLMLLALGAFLAGVSLLSIQLCFLGAVLAAAVPTISWLQNSLLFLVVAGVFVVGLGLAFLPTKAKGKAPAAEI